MLTVHNIFGQDPAEDNEEYAASRIGDRIRKIRKEKGLSQAELGKMVGLTGDRIQKYENGVRKPKIDLLKKIALELDVETLALVDPNVSNSIGAMYALFEMEERYGLQVQKKEGRYILTSNKLVGGLNDYLASWYEERELIQSKLATATSKEEQESIIKEYNYWKRNFSRAISINQDINLTRKEELQKTIAFLQKQLSDLDNTDKS